MGGIFSTAAPASTSTIGNSTSGNSRSKSLNASLVTQEGTTKLKCYAENSGASEKAEVDEKVDENKVSGGGKKKKKNKKRKTAAVKKNKKKC